MTEQIRGVLEIDRERGVVYFHAQDSRTLKRYGAQTILRVCQIPDGVMQPDKVIDFAYNQQTRLRNQLDIEGAARE